MGIIKKGDVDNSGLQIYNWKVSLIDSVNNIATLKSSLNAQLDNMKLNNVDFTIEDVAEMEALIEEVNQLIATLL